MTITKQACLTSAVSSHYTTEVSDIIISIETMNILYKIRASLGEEGKQLLVMNNYYSMSIKYCYA